MPRHESSALTSANIRLRKQIEIAQKALGFYCKGAHFDVADDQTALIDNGGIAEEALSCIEQIEQGCEEWPKFEIEEVVQPTPEIKLSTAVAHLIDQKRRLAKAKLITDADRRHLTFSAYALANITIDKAAELLGVTILDIREQFPVWLEVQPAYVQAAAEIALNSEENPANYIL